MIFLDNQTNEPISIDLLQSIADTLTDRDVELIVCHNDYIQELNRQHRSKDKATDVLSFPIESDHAHMPLGSIVISYDQIDEMSQIQGHSKDDELALLFVHGLLHLLGYDHEVDNGEMREKEHEIIREFDLPESLIVRTGES